MADPTEMEHEMSADCWCCPDVIPADPDDEDGAWIVVHRSKAEAN